MQLTGFPVSTRWPVRHPDRVQVYSWPTPNGVKVTIALEEIGLPYEVHLVDIEEDETWSPEFLALNPNGKIPAIIDPDGPGGEPLALFESGAILQYFGERTGRLWPADPKAHWEAVQWLVWQVAAVGPAFGQVGWFHRFAGREIEDGRPLARYAAESRRLLGIMEDRLRSNAWMMGDDFTLVDVALVGMVRNLVGFYNAGDLVGFDDLRAVPDWLRQALARPTVKRGLAALDRDLSLPLTV